MKFQGNISKFRYLEIFSISIIQKYALVKSKKAKTKTFIFPFNLRSVYIPTIVRDETIFAFMDFNKSEKLYIYI